MIDCCMKGLEWSVGARAHGEGRINSSGSVLPGCEGFSPQPGSRLTGPGGLCGGGVSVGQSLYLPASARQCAVCSRKSLLLEGVVCLPLSKSLSSYPGDH